MCVWLREDREFQDQYARAREAQADSLAEEIIEIADGKGDVQRDRLRIDARMFSVDQRKTLSLQLRNLG